MNQSFDDMETTGSRESVEEGSIRDGGSAYPIRLLAIIVIYKMPPLETSSYLSLQQAKRALPAGRIKMEILLFDNSPNAQKPEKIPENVRYQAADQNVGLSSAYNKGLSLAVATGYDWLLTLDQDTTLPADFLVHLSEVAATVAHDTSVAAIVPSIKSGGKYISPVRFVADALPRYDQKGKVGTTEEFIYALNSASTLRVAALREVGGYNPWFWLDHSDGYIFRQLHRYGKRVFIMGDLEVAHDFSMMQPQHRVTAARYRNMLLAETALWDQQMGRLGRLERIVDLARVVAKQCLAKESIQYRKLAIEFLMRRIFWTRKRRLAAWEREILQQFPDLSQRRQPPFFGPDTR